MILRRITQHVKDQNWFAVALDFLIVVTGILIAFQITNWSETRDDRAQEQQIVERLYSDFEALGHEVDEKIVFMEPLIETIEEIEQLIIKGVSETDFERLQAFYETAFVLPAITGQSDTYEQLVSSGDAYDAFMRDGFVPWVAQMRRVHDRVDILLGVSHQKEITP